MGATVSAAKGKKKGNKPGNKPGKGKGCPLPESQEYWKGRVNVGGFAPGTVMSITVKSGKKEQKYEIFSGDKTPELDLAQPWLLVTASHPKIKPIKKRFKVQCGGGKPRLVNIGVTWNSKRGKVIMRRATK